MNERAPYLRPVSELASMHWLPLAAWPSDGEEGKPTQGPQMLHGVRGQGEAGSDPGWRSSTPVVVLSLGDSF